MPPAIEGDATPALQTLDNSPPWSYGYRLTFGMLYLSVPLRIPRILSGCCGLEAKSSVTCYFTGRFWYFWLLRLKFKWHNTAYN